MTCSRSEASSAGSEDLTLDSNAQECKLCGSASRTSSASGSSRGTGRVSRAIPTCAPLWPTPRSQDAKHAAVTGYELSRHRDKDLLHVRIARLECPCRCHTSTSSAAASPAKTSPTPAKEQGSTGNARVFGPNTHDSFANYDPATSSWRTSQLSLLEDSGVFSGTWPRAGMTRSGIASRLVPSAPLTAGTGSGSSRIPTPTAGDSRNAANLTAGRSDLDSKHHSGTTLVDFTRMWPTPTTSEHTGPGHSTKGGKNLRTVVAEREEWATPTAHPRTHTPRRVDHGRQLANEVGGSLNPRWVAKLMGFPADWLDL